MIRDLSRNLKVRSILSRGPKKPPLGDHPIIGFTTHVVRITADEMVLEDNMPNPFRAAGVDVSADINVTGAGGLDTGVKSSGKWYDVWVIAGNGPAKGLFSRASSEPVLPPGYSYKAYVGTIYNHASDYLIYYCQNGNSVWAEKSCPLPMTSFPMAGTAVNLTESVPPRATSVLMELSGLTTTGGHFLSNVSVGSTSDGPWYNQLMMVAGSNADHVQISTQCEVILDTAQTIYALVGTENDQLQISVLGWRY